MIGAILAILNLISKFIPTPADRQRASDAIQENYQKFLQTTDSPLYSAVRTLEILGALWDAFFNGGRAFAQTASVLSQSPYGLIELVVLLWPFLGNTLSAIGTQALQAGLKAYVSNPNAGQKSAFQPGPSSIPPTYEVRRDAPSFTAPSRIPPDSHDR